MKFINNFEYLLMAQKYKNNKQAGRKPSFVSAPPQQKAKQEKKGWTLSSKYLMAIPLVSIIVFAVIAAYFLIAENSDMLFMAQSKSRFMFGETFWNECLLFPGAALSWLSSYFVQYFYEPTLGSGIIIAMWVALFFITKWTFKVRNEWSALMLLPLVALLVSMIDIGYWLYYIKCYGYWFVGTIGMLFAMIMTFIGVQSFGISQKRTVVNFGFIIAAVLSFFSYRYFGTFGLIPFIYIPIYELVKREHSKICLIITAVISVLIIVAIPLIESNIYYTNINPDTVWLYNIPSFKADAVNSTDKVTPFYYAILTPIILAFTQKKGKTNASVKGWYALLSVCVTVAILVSSFMIADKKNFDNYNYHAEMRMYRAIDEQRWDDALEVMASIPGDASREMVLFKNIALLNNGHMCDRMFKYNNMGEPPYVDDSLSVHMVQTAAPLIYFNHAKINFAYRWCIENSVEYGYSFDNLKMLAKCAIINHEWDLARRYLDILKQSLYYKDWAEKYESLVDEPAKFADYHEFDNVYELYSHMGSVLDGDNGLCEMYLLNYFANTQNKDSKLLQELTLNYAMIQKDIQLFWPRFFLYAQLHNGEPMPQHYQEAAYLYGNLEPQTMSIQGMPFDENIKKRYADFQQTSQSLLRTGLDATGVGQSMKATYGDTFWWFYFFCRNIHSY